MMAVNDLPFEVLPWDSDFFGVKIGRVIARNLTNDSFANLDSWSRDEDVECIYCLIDADDRVSIRTAESHGFGLVDLRVDLIRPPTISPSPPRTKDATSVRKAAETDIDPLKRIARGAHRDSRFYFDERFDSSRVDELFETWIENSCRGWADLVLVLDIVGIPSGYVTCHRDGEQARIGLFALAEAARGRGYASVLLAAAIDATRADGALELRVTTQGRNDAAQRMYQRAGFLTESTRLWYHWWPRCQGKRGPAHRNPSAEVER
jgi:dTDP-4-amino-4,6-dideoxy-D-galactose acyltransferase